MAIMIIGKTACGICGLPITSSKGALSFPPFVSNRRDPLYSFSDGSFHISCLNDSPDSSAAQARCAAMRSRGAKGARKCATCRQEIVSPDEYFGVGFLTDDSASGVREFNYLHFHKTHFELWSRAAAFRERMEAFLRSDAWDGPTLVYEPAPRWVVKPRGGLKRQRT